jgi:hypothetical protein
MILFMGTPTGFESLDPLLQLLLVVALCAFLALGGFKLWRYALKRRMRSRAKIWVIY